MPDETKYRPHFSLNKRLLARVLVFMLCALAVCLTLSSGVFARSQGEVSATSSSLAGSFQMSARHWGVPVEILMAIGYVESHWEPRNGGPSIDHGYGIMHLVDAPDGTLPRGAALTGLSEDAIKTTSVANIEAGAAVLDDISRKLNMSRASRANLTEWFASVAEYSGSLDRSVKDGYAREVYRVIEQGVSSTLSSGEVMDLHPSSVMLPQTEATTPNSADYSPALWVPANPNNYLAGRPYGPLNFIIIHDTEGSYSSAINWFQNATSGVSAHYVVRSSDGQITQVVREANTAYQAGNWDYNVRALGIEHEGFMNQSGWYTEAMYQASSALARNMADRYGIKKDRAHIIGHYQVPNQSHVDPGPNWDWGHYMSLVRQDSVRAALVDNTDTGFAAAPMPIDPQHHWYTYQGGNNGSNAYTTISVSSPQSSVNSATWTAHLQNYGYYDVYAFIPWVDNHTSDTASAHYKVYAADGQHTVTVSQRAITDVGDGSWAHVGTFLFNGDSDAQVSLDDNTGESGRNVWFDALMWIPSAGGVPIPTDTPTLPPSTRTPASTPAWTPGPCGMRFTDLPDSDWAYGFVANLFCKGIISGYGDSTFRPGESATRAQLTKMLTLAFGLTLYNPISPDFSDVPFDSVYYQFVETAYYHRIISGYSDGRFRPNDPITRAQVTKMVVLGKGWDLINPAQPDFIDVRTNHWAYSFIETALAQGIVNGYSDSTFHPNELVNRAQFSKMLTLALQRAAR